MARTKVQAELIADNALTATLIPDGTLTATQLAANCVDSAELVTGSIDTIHIAANNVTAAKIASNSILTRHIQDDQISGDQLTNTISIAGTLDVAGAVNFNGGAFTFNEASADLNFRIESNGDANNFFSDGGEDRIGIGTGTPSTKLDVVGSFKASGAVDLDGGAFTWNQTGASLDFRCETNNLDDAFFIDGSADKVALVVKTLLMQWLK